MTIWIKQLFYTEGLNQILVKILLPDFFTNSSVFCLYIWFIFCCLWLLQLYIAVLRFPVVQLVYYIVGFVSGAISPYYKFFLFLSTKIFFAKILIFATFALPVFWEAQKSRSGYGLYGNLRLTLFPYMPVAGSHGALSVC